MNVLRTLIVLVVFLVSTTSATDLNGKISIINNDGMNYQIVLQINTNTEPQELGGATIIINYDKSELSFPGEPEIGEDFVFYNFSQGYYDDATVTKVTDDQIWINVDLLSDDHGTLVAAGPYQWTDLVLLNFESNRIISHNVVFWNIYSPYWGIYSSDNQTIWGIGDFDNPTTLIENEIINDQLNSFMLNQNYPNPFNPNTKITWYSPTSEWQTLKLYDILGNELATLVDEFLPAGNHEIEFSILNGSINNLASGVYFYRLQIGSFVESKKMVLMK